MIAARMHADDGGIIIMLVLEPGNFEKLKEGVPIHKLLNEFMPELTTKVELLFAYTPDVAWVAEQMKGSQDALRLAEIIDESRSRKEVIVRDRSAEDLRRIV